MKRSSAHTARAGAEAVANSSRSRATAPGGYVGRFAPSPSGPLHAGSLVAALASWLDARAHRGRWLLRIEDIDTPRCSAAAARQILEQLAACGLHADAPPLWQSTRSAAYADALQRLVTAGWAYPCGCTRRDIEQTGSRHGLERPRNAERVYPGTCRQGLAGKPARALRLRAAPAANSSAPLVIDWRDRCLGAQQQNVTEQVGDFVLKRADGLWAYQLAVVVDDAAQGVTHVVRGADLADNTPRQIHLQHCLGLAQPEYLHTPLLLAADGAKLSKQNGAAAFDSSRPLDVLLAAGNVLGLRADGAGNSGTVGVGDWLTQATVQWRERRCGAVH